MKRFVTLLLALLPFATANAEGLPDMIRCNQENTGYQLVIVLRSPQLPDGVTALGLRKGPSVIFKVATQMYIDADSGNVLKFMEVPATENSKEANLNTDTKMATLKNFHMNDLAEGSSFVCQF